MRVIAGTARSVRLIAPAGIEVRPTLDRVRESLFNILGPRLAGCRFLDLFAGTGANGIEALSRGAASATFVEAAPKVVAVLRANLAHTHLEAGARIVSARLPHALTLVRGPFDVVFADPPYDFPHYPEILEGLVSHSLVAEGGVAVFEHTVPDPLPVESGPLRRVRDESYGDTWLSFYS